MIRFALTFLLAMMTTSAWAAEPKAAKRFSAVIFPVFSESREGQNLALGIADRAGSELFASRRANHFHLKQVFSMARSHHLTSKQLASSVDAKRAARVMGASCGAFGTLSEEGGGWKLAWTAFDLQSGKQDAGTLSLPRDAAAAVKKGGRAVAGSVARLHGVVLAAEGPVHPDTASGEAMEAYLQCYRIIINQPMGLRKSHTIEPSKVTRARTSCLAAVKTDPEFAAAWATLSVVYSLSFRKDDAARTLGKAARAEGYLAFARIARYWWATRFGGNQEGALVLQETIERHPGALIFLTYLGEHLNITRRYAEAEETWQRYLALVPASPFALAQQGYSLARLGKLDQAIDLTMQANLIDADSLELKLELASRLVDAKRLKQAEDLLTPMTKNRRVFGEVLLRLGYVYLLQGRDAEAEAMLARALAMARGPHEWRTRGRTRYDLAIVMARKGKLAEAEEHLLEAAREGFMMRELLRANADLKPLASRPGVRHLFEGSGPRRTKLRLHTSPFPVDAAGDVQPDAERKAPPMTGITF